MRRWALLPALMLIVGCTGSQVGPRAALHARASKPTQTAVGGPRWYAVLRSGHVQWYDASSAQPLGLSGGPAHERITAIASAHDGRSILLAARRGGSAVCAGFVQRQRVHSPDRLDESEVRFLHDLPGVVDTLALSLDGTKVATVLQVPEQSGGKCAYVQLRLVDLRDGSQRIWTMPESSDESGYGSFFISPIAWSPDNRHLAVHYGQCCADGAGIWILDTNVPAGPLLPRLHRFQPAGECTTDGYGWTAQGVITDDAGCTPNLGRLIAVDPQTERTTDLTGPELDVPIESVSADPTGDHLLIYDGQRLLRVDHGSTRPLMPLPWNPEAPPAAVW